MDPMLPRLILVPTDFGEQADKAVRYALELAKKLDARVELVHVWSIPIVSYPDMMVPLPATVIDDVARDAQERMERAVAQNKTPGIAVSGAVVCGDARQSVIETADQHQANLIVMGTHGRRGLKRAVLGSVAEAVVRHAHCPVLVVR